MYAWLGLGSNLGEPGERLKEALKRLAELNGLEILEVSSFYRTPPWGDEEQAEFVNAVVKIETSLDPAALLQGTQSVEDAMGRQRSERRWGPRIIDIDLLLYDNLIYRSDTLILPHPYMHERAFVLLPLSELDGLLEIPGHGVVEELLWNLDCDDIHRLTDKGSD